ncbi:MAG: hypothetical protein KKF67_03470 [Nanoarchaeota archaeon]|nr:hypothetical protein [Nanoarchaeota archaeon]
MSNQIIWQPQKLYQPGYDFEILLNSEFAEEMFNSKLSKEKYQRMQKLPKELMGFQNHEPYIFHENTCFIRRINLNAGNGKWLSLDDACGGAKPDFAKPLKYSTRNFDYRTSYSDVVTLMGLFDLWVEYSGLLKE